MKLYIDDIPPFPDFEPVYSESHITIGKNDKYVCPLIVVVTVCIVILEYIYL